MKAPEIKNAIDFQYIIPKISKVNFSNDIPLYYLNSGTQAVIQIEWVFEAGIWHEQKNATAHATSALMKSGTTSNDALSINESIEFYGASLRVVSNNDYTTLILHVMNKHLAQVLPWVKSLMTEANYPDTELAIYKQNALQRLSTKLLEPDFVANRHIEAMLFGRQHPYGRYNEAHDIKNVERTDLLAFHAAHIHAANCKIFAAGLVTESEIQLIETFFGIEAWGSDQGETSIGKEHQVQATINRQFQLINNEDGVQAALRVAKPFIHKDHPDFLPMQVLNTVLGGFFGSRLMMNIREEKGFTYGIYSYLAAYKHETMLMITTEVQRAVADQALEEIYKELRALQSTRIPAEELLLVKNYLLGGLLGDLDGVFSIMRYWKSLILNHQDDTEFYRRIDLMKSVTSNDLLHLAQKYLNPETFYEVKVI